MKLWGPCPSAFAFGLFVAMGQAKADCSNGIVDPSEADVDCGGRCAPCDHGRACLGARDCQSGRCAGHRCEERPYIDGDPVPPGYRVEYSATDSSAIARTIGVVSLGVGYGAAYVAALALPGELSALYVPVFGPWIAVADGSQGKPGLIALDGALQVVGFSLLVGGLFTGGSQLLRDDPDQAAPLEVSVSPMVDGGFRFGLRGGF
jgi:hypothetical protein